MKERLMNDLKQAMKEKNTIEKLTIQSIRASILQAEKDNQKELNDKEIENIIMKEKKKRQDTMKMLENSDREDLKSQTTEEISIIDRYLPKQLSSEELKSEIVKIVNEINANSLKELGITMKTCKERIGNKANGKEMSEIVKEVLKEREESNNG